MVALIREPRLTWVKRDTIPAYVLDSKDKGKRTHDSLLGYFERVEQAGSPGIVRVKTPLRQGLNGDGRPGKGGNNQVTLSAQHGQTLRAGAKRNLTARTRCARRTGYQQQEENKTGCWPVLIERFHARGRILTLLQTTSACRRAMRSSMGGWVEKSLNSAFPRIGLTMNRCEVAGLASMGKRLAPISSFCRAETNANGL